jgi:branched-chain amino acid transport system substrate-binding protein
VVPYQTAQASAAVLVFADAFERANSFDRDKVRDALSATDMETFYGDIKFAPEGNNIAKPMFYRQIQADATYKPIITHDDMAYPRQANY